MRYVEMLTDADIEFGARLWHALRRNKDFPVEGMLWLLHGDPGEWHLVVASPMVDLLGMRDALLKISDLIKNIREEVSQFIKLMPISPRDSLYQALRSVFGQTASVEGTRLANTMVGGFFIDEAYLYEVK